MPGRERFQPADAAELLTTISSLKDDIEEMRPRVVTGEIDQKEAFDRLFQGLSQLATAVEPLLKDYGVRH